METVYGHQPDGSSPWNKSGNGVSVSKQIIKTVVPGGLECHVCCVASRDAKSDFLSFVCFLGRG